MIEFINSLSLPINIVSVIQQQPHASKAMSGWVGICSLVTQTDRSQIYDIDLRYAWGDEIFNQFLFDCGWNQELLINCKSRGENRHKLIIYICDRSIDIPPDANRTLPPDFMIGRYWQSVTHIYIPDLDLIPIPDLNSIARTQGYATTINLSPHPNPSLKIDFPDEPTEHQQIGGLRTKGLHKFDRDGWPLVSIVTVVFNGKRYIEQTIQSVINQSYPNVEYIIIDGGSTDGTLDIIRKYDSYLNYWVSDPDRGIYNAMNKGTALASGRYIIHLNADDLLFDGSCLEFMQFAQPEANYMRSILKLNIDTNILTKDPPDRAYADFPDNILYRNKFFNLVRAFMPHPGFVGFRNSALLFKEQYKIISDTVMLTHKYRTETVHRSPEVMAIFRTGGASSNRAVMLAEMMQEISQAKGLGAKLSTWLQLQGIYLYYGDK
jgi:hypothetical protein